MLDGLQLWWPDVTAFVQMGRHGPYVWGSVLATALALGLEQWGLRRQSQSLAARSNEEARP